MRKLKMYLLIILFVLIGYIGIIEYVSYQTIKAGPTPQADYVIVLGAKANGMKPTRFFAERLDGAYLYLRDNPETKVIITGGRGDDEEFEESYVGKMYLMGLGIEADRIIEENKSTNTFENLLFSKQIVGSPSASVVVVSNDFHIFRARLLANRLFLNVSFIGTSTPFYLSSGYRIREYVATIKSFVKDRP